MSTDQYWFIDRAGQQQGVPGIEALRYAVTSQQLTADAMVYDPAVGAWQRAVEAPVLAGMFGGFPAAPVPKRQMWSTSNLTPLRLLITALAFLAAWFGVQFLLHGLPSSF